MKFLFLIIFLAGLCCKTAQEAAEDLSVRCCKECLEAFSQSPVGVGAAGVQCGEFTTAQSISQPCVEYFKQHPQTVANCE